MKNYRLYLFILLALLPLVILIIVVLSPGNFRPDAYKQAIPSFTRKNLVGHQELKSLMNPLIINLDSSKVRMHVKMVIIPAWRIGEPEHVKMIRHHKGPVVLWSENPSVSARAWMILAQLGIEKAYVLTDDRANEVLKYKFKPDTLRPGT